MKPSDPDPKPESKGNPRQCYCASLSAESRREQNIPDGFCGICERCGAPGHTQHFPGPIPYTGAWCDRCVRIVALTWPLKNPLVWAALAIVAIIVVTILRR